jgi:hypothetical protein
MKVLESKPWAWVFDCKGCASKLEAGLADMKVGYFGGGYCERGDKKYYAVCPLCGSESFLPANKVVPKVEECGKPASVLSAWD